MNVLFILSFVLNVACLPISVYTLDISGPKFCISARFLIKRIIAYLPESLLLPFTLIPKHTHTLVVSSCMSQ